MKAASNAGILSFQSTRLVTPDDADIWESGFLAVAVASMEEHSHSPTLGRATTHVACVDEIVQSDVIREERKGISPRNTIQTMCFPLEREAGGRKGPYHVRLLRQYDIVAMPEPLACYPHRMQDFESIYGRTVATQTGAHQLCDSIPCNEGLPDDMPPGGLSVGFLAALLPQPATPPPRRRQSKPSTSDGALTRKGDPRIPVAGRSPNPEVDGHQLVRHSGRPPPCDAASLGPKVGATGRPPDGRQR
jgi:hypothetical protein